MFRQAAGYTIIIANTLIVQALGAYATFPAIQDGWYAKLSKPAFNPPAAVFGPVWTALYLMMAFAACRVWSFRETRNVTPAMMAYGVQLLLNLAWSIAFFGYKSPLAGLIDILLLDAGILVSLVLFLKIDTLSAMFLVPYFVWVSFATALNAAIFSLNS
jgi:translocator protein